MQDGRSNSHAILVGGAYDRKPEIRRERRAAKHEFDVRHCQFGPRLDECVQAARYHRAWPGTEHVGADHVHRHAVEAHLTVKPTSTLAAIGHVRAKMVLQVLADRHVENGFDAMLAQMRSRS